MNKAFARLCLLASALFATALSAQGVIQQVGPVTANHVAAWWANGQVYDGGAVPLPNTTNAWTAKQTFGPSSLNSAPVSILPGIAPQSPANGDIWTTNAGLFLRANNITQGPLSSYGTLWGNYSVVNSGGVAGNGNNNTSPVDTMLGQLSPYGGRALFSLGNWRFNSIVSQTNTYLSGNRGFGEDSAWPALRPWSTGNGTATVTLGNGTALASNIRFENLSITGDNGSGAMADSALKVQSVSQAYLDNIDLTDGIQTLSLVPSANQPVTSFHLSNFRIRNNGASSASRAVYVKRLADPGYFTSSSLRDGHINAPTGGYGIEVDGSSNQTTLFLDDVYLDCSSGHCVKLTTNGQIKALASQLDPGATGVPVINTDTSPAVRDPTTLIDGQLYVAGQKIQWGDATTTTFGPYSEWFLREPTIHDMYFYGSIYLSKSTDFYDTSQSLDMASNTGPFRVNGTDFRANSADDSSSTTSGALQSSGGLGVAKNIWVGSDVNVMGGNAFRSGTLSSATSNGGISLAALGVGANLDVRLTPKGIGVVRADGVLRLPSFIVSALPSCASVGQGSEAWVTDASVAPSAASYWTIVVGGGANKAKLTCDGTDWRIG